MKLRSPEVWAALSTLCNETIPFHRAMRFKLQSDAPVTIRFAMAKELVGHPVSGRLHGGVASAALDSVGGFAMMVALAEKHASESVKVSSSFTVSSPLNTARI
jgi:acyl-coenzyme A thioesterase PaaI-like protein